MKRIISLIIVFLSVINFSISQDFTKIAEFKLDTKELAKTIPYQSTQFIFQSKQKTDFHYAFDLIDIIKPHIESVALKDRKKLVFVLENENGESVTAAYSEFDILLTNSPAVLLSDEVKIKTSDSLVLEEKEGDIDMSEIEGLSQFATRRRIFLQIKNIPVPEKQRMLQNATVIFTKDLNSERWINGVNMIKVFKYESGIIPAEPIPVPLEEPQDTKKSKKK